MGSPEREALFAGAADAYARAVAGYQPDTTLRESAARQFLADAAALLDGAAEALPLLEAELRGPRVEAAVRVLLLGSDPTAPRLILDAYRQPRRPRLRPSLLGLLGRAAPLPPETRACFDEADAMTRPHLLRALLVADTPEARALLQETIARDPDGLAVVAVRAAARWGDEALLRTIAADGALAPRACAREASLRLALGGDRAMLGWLQSVADSGDAALALDGGRALAHLAWPGAVASLAALLRGADAAAAAAALESVTLLGAMALGPVLLELTARTDVVDDAPLAELALTTLGDLLGTPLPDGIVGDAAVAFFRDALARVDLRARYLSAAPNRPAEGPRAVTLPRLAELLADVANPARADNAGDQLRAMTGEDHGFDGADDLIANLPAIAAWRTRAERDPAVEPGGWMYAGALLPPPPLP